jgi:hypothetical protein
MSTYYYSIEDDEHRFTLIREGIEKTYSFDKHKINVSYKKFKDYKPSEWTALLGKPAEPTALQQEDMVYYIEVKPYIGTNIYIWLKSKKEATNLRAAIHKASDLLAADDAYNYKLNAPVRPHINYNLAHRRNQMGDCPPR